ncbi:rhamnogalacturonan lyase family protein [Flavobacterium undicola]|uniref:rhamnogalacturonan lyase family protein n=1 Tax=Flavobacterium undicola TaxID=1932779 RepID=UPI001378F15D|nr:T9SS type A sorting domain-containing protein [Flavobacterium undicola]MBA0883407.1 T9SS type A sorting domain-containing protein [Flavobacterium undicola]
MIRKTTFSSHRLRLKISLSMCFLFSCLSSFAQQWTILGNEQAISSVSSSYTSIAVVKIGTNFIPYVAFTESGVPKVKKRLTDGTWEQVGANLATNASYTKIYSNSIGELFVAYIDFSAGSKLALKKYDYVTRTWNALNEDNTNLYVSTGNANGMSAVSQYSSTHRCSIAFDSFNVPYVAFSEAGMLPYVKKFNGTAWETVGSGAVPGGFGAAVSLAIDANDKPWLTYLSLTAANSTTGTVALYGYNGTAWTAVTIPTPMSGRHTNIAIKDANTLCIAYFNTGNTNRATAILYNKSTNTWGTAATLASRDSPNISLINDNAGNVYCSFIDYTSTTNVFPTRVRFLAAGSTTWTELKDPAVIRGIDEPTGSPSIAIGNAPYPYVVYTKTNSNSITTPIVRMYTPPPPPAELTTNNITNISTTTAVAGGNITSDGGAAISQRGVVYSNSNSSPTTADTKVVATTTGSGSFSVTLTGLTPATFYYVRAYAINSAGTSYGNTVRLSSLPVADAVVTTPKQVEFLTRGLVAIQKTSSSVFLSWRLLGNDPSSIAFNVYRNGVKVNATPITTSTNYLDATTTPNNNYSITTIINGVESEQTSPTKVWALNTFNSGRNNKLSIPIQMPAGGTLPDGQSYTYTANDSSVGDVDGDGVYEIILKWDPTAVNDNAGGYSGKQIFDCYRLDGTRLWRIDLGINVNAGPHYNQFMVYDFDGDGKAEMILKTADGTVDGVGNVIGNAAVDYRNSAGWVQQGPEFLTVFNGLTGAAMATVNYQPTRDNVADWGDTYGNRQDRFVSAVAYLDGARPSIIVGRGYYNRLTRAAYNWRNGQLTMLWKFDSKDPTHPEYNSYSGQGNHQMTIGDVDGDGKDEIINGSSAINDDGKPLWTYGMGHGDALHMTDMDLDRPGQEIWINLESPGSYDGLGLRQYDAKTGQTNWGIATTGDVGRSMAADIDPYFKGYEMWGSSGDNTYDVKGNPISTNKPSYNFGIWWDGDLGRELLDGNVMDKWNPTTKSQSRLFTIYQAYPVSSNNSTKKNPCLQADILGDWREEIIFRTSDNTELVIFTTDTPTTYRIPTLMHDPQYRTAIAWQNSAYNQPPNTSYYIGYDMDVNNIPTAKIAVVDVVAPKVTAINRLTPTSEKNNATTVTYRVTFSENVSGVDVADFAFNTTGNVAGTIASVSPVTNASFDVTVNNISGDGTLRLDVNNSGTGIADGANNAIAEGFTNGEIYTFDHTNPTLTITTISSSNAKPIFAKEADTVTLNFEASESITNLEATIAGHAVTTTDLGSNKFNATYQLTNTDTEGIIPFTIQFKDQVGNTGIPVSATTDAKTIVFDRTVPTLPSVQLSSNNINSAYAKEGDVISLSFTASETIETPAVVIAGHAVSITDLGSNNYIATYQLTNTDTEGSVGFTIDFTDPAGNIGSKVTTATNSITYDRTNPSITTPTDLNISSNNGSCEATKVVLGTASTNDTNTVETTNDAPSIFPVGTTTVIWIAKDAAGNSNTATQKVTIIDSQKPLISNSSSQSFCYNGSTYTIPTLSATDNCGIASISYIINGATSRSGNGNDASGIFNVGVSTITWTVSDIHNNQSTVNSTVTVNAAVSVTINDIYAVNQATDNKNTLYIGYGPSSLKLTAKPNGGSGSFGFKWSTGETTPSINASTAGTYSVVITDAQGCTTNTSAAINVIDVSCGNNKDKVMICHNGTSICVASSAVQAHLNHGDNIGACGTYSKVAKSPILETTSSVESGLSVYPNPTSGSFSIQINSLTSGKATINIVTINGQIVEQRDVVLTEGIQSFSFNISGKASGVYLIKVSGIEGVNTQNLILQN